MLLTVFILAMAQECKSYDGQYTFWKWLHDLNRQHFPFSILVSEFLLLKNVSLEALCDDSVKVWTLVHLSGRVKLAHWSD